MPAVKTPDEERVLPHMEAGKYKSARGLYGLALLAAGAGPPGQRQRSRG
jgi:hypothetical protein